MSTGAPSGGSGYDGLERSEAIPVLGRARTDAAGERAPQRLGRTETGGRGNLVDGQDRGLEQAPCDLDPDQFDVRRGRAPHVGPEDAGEVPRTHRHPRREPIDGVVGVGMLADPCLELAQRVPRGALRVELRAELRLTAGTLHVHDELARDGAGNVLAHVVGDEREREIHARGDAGRRPDVAAAHEDAIALDDDFGVFPLQALARGPMGGRRPPVEQSRGGEDERTRTHRGDAAAAAGEVRDRAHELRVTGGGERALAADDDERVDRAPHRRQRTVRDDPRPAPGDDRTGLGAGDDELVTAGRAEHLVRPDQVERGDAGIDDEDDSAAHGPIVRRAAAWQQRQSPDDSCHSRRGRRPIGPRPGCYKDADDRTDVPPHLRRQPRQRTRRPLHGAGAAGVPRPRAPHRPLRAGRRVGARRRP